MISSILFTISLLLLSTATLLANACPTGGADQCQDGICQPYYDSIRSEGPVYISVYAELSELTNRPLSFKPTSSSLNYRDYPTLDSGITACYSSAKTNKTGCGHKISVLDHKTQGDLECPWDYQCDYNQNRIPQYLWKAKCRTDNAVTVNYTVPVLKREACNSLSPWQMVIEYIPVACTCLNA